MPSHPEKGDSCYCAVGYIAHLMGMEPDHDPTSSNTPIYEALNDWLKRYFKGVDIYSVYRRNDSYRMTFAEIADYLEKHKK